MTSEALRTVILEGQLEIKKNQFIMQYLWTGKLSKQNVNQLYNNVELCVLTSKTKAKQSTTVSH